MAPATRVVVRCRSQNIPGEPREREKTMADMICQHIWNRPFDKAQDRLETHGMFLYDGNRVYTMVDNGPLDSQEVSTFLFKWNGKRFIELPMNPIWASRLKDYPFNGERPQRKSYTDEEYRNTFGEEKYGELLMARIRQRRKWGAKLLPCEETFLEEHPELASQL